MFVVFAFSPIGTTAHKKYHGKEIYLFVSYVVRGEADAKSDLDFLIFGGDGSRLTEILSLGEELREVL